MKDKTRIELKLQMLAFLLLIPSNYAPVDNHTWIWTTIFLIFVAINSLSLSIDSFRKFLQARSMTKK